MNIYILAKLLTLFAAVAILLASSLNAAEEKPHQVDKTSSDSITKTAPKPNTEEYNFDKIFDNESGGKSADLRTDIGTISGDFLGKAKEESEKVLQRYYDRYEKPRPITKSSINSDVIPHDNSSENFDAPSQGTSKSATMGGVTSIKRDGKYTIVKCSVGKDTKVHHDDYGKCSDNYQFGSYGCSSVIKWAKERCENR